VGWVVGSIFPSAAQSGAMAVWAMSRRKSDILR
jgi:hypothetical protein